MGDYIAIEEQKGPFDFLCSSVTTGTLFIARIDEDKQDLFLDHKWIEQHPNACTFLRPIGDRIVCTIHETSPIQCKAYRCVVMQIFSPDEKLIGKVTGTLSLHTDDPELWKIWEESDQKSNLNTPNVEDQIFQFLESRGYKII